MSRQGEMKMAAIINTIITFIMSTLLGYCLKSINAYKQKLKEKTTNEQLQNTALMTLLKNNLTSTYFVYSELKQIPDYVYQNFLDELEVYERLGGNTFIGNISHKMESWKITKTDIL